tara:strand:+ start:261 stop:638 length:378 start_codon:yes stop_codon:yes gene_type:complete
MTTTPQTNQINLPEENFGKITISSALTFYMDRNPEVVNQVFDYLEQHYMKGIFNGGRDNQQLCKQVIDAEDGGILYGWYTLHTKNTDRKIMIKTVGYGLKENQMDLKQFTKADYNNTCIMFPSDD